MNNEILDLMMLRFHRFHRLLRATDNLKTRLFNLSGFVFIARADSFPFALSFGSQARNKNKEGLLMVSFICFSINIRYSNMGVKHMRRILFGSRVYDRPTKNTNLHVWLRQENMA